MNWNVPLFFVAFTALFYFYIQYGNSDAAIYEWPVGIKLATSVAVVSSFYFSLLSHGLMRAFMASRRGYKVNDITIFSLGIASNLSSNTNFKDELRITFAGLGANLLIIALLYPLAVAAIDNLTLSLIFAHVFYINVAIVVLSLILRAPIYGGQALRTIIWSVSHNRYLSSKIPVRVGQIFGGLLILPLLPLVTVMAIWGLVNSGWIGSNLVIYNFFVVVGAYVNPLISLTGSLLGALVILIAIQIFGLYVFSKANTYNQTLKHPDDLESLRASKAFATIGQLFGLLVLYPAVIVSFFLWGVANVVYDSWLPEVTNPLSIFTESSVVTFTSITSGLISLIGVYVFCKATAHKLKLRRSKTDQRES